MLQLVLFLVFIYFFKVRAHGLFHLRPEALLHVLSVPHDCNFTYLGSLHSSILEKWSYNLFCFLFIVFTSLDLIAYHVYLIP
jgi:hypothetical protein